MKLAWTKLGIVTVMIAITQDATQLACSQSHNLITTSLETPACTDWQCNVGYESKAAREIVDPSTGNHWMLLKNAAHPAGPGRLVLVDGSRQKTDAPFAAKAQPLAVTVSHSSQQPLIHVGDSLIVEEHSPIADVRLEAIALASAMAGEELNVRLKVGGKVVRAVASSAGHATFALHHEVLR